jgi:serine/threonine protein kinase
MNERNILTSIGQSGFIVNCLEASQDSSNLYLLMEYMPGGDLRYMMYRFRRRFSEGQASKQSAKLRISRMLLTLGIRSPAPTWNYPSGC